MRFSKVVKVGDVLLGGGNKITVQSMTCLLYTSDAADE